MGCALLLALVLRHVEFDLVGEAEELALQEGHQLALAGDAAGAKIRRLGARFKALLVHTLLEGGGLLA